MYRVILSIFLSSVMCFSYHIDIKTLYLVSMTSLFGGTEEMTWSPSVEGSYYRSSIVSIDQMMLSMDEAGLKIMYMF